ncbi:PEP-CTERM sorting domain-containing protein [Nitrosospira multiformis]|uniref:PEP-CTERM sorting domain-containing protein n=1 Tax=Nitrosospira multiformis TaxID=1231 RepID=UPI00089A4133|nr:PEP-CTERM sorting domain-containing protein [Nitrosospira multiformis]SEA62342.1 PEP-CTERM protein-sorting domain-containing protein [Nitrosospira multiformis]
MKKVLLGLGLFYFSVTSQASTTIDDITLFNSQNPGQIWITTGTFHWILGVSDKPEGPLLNQPDTSIKGIPLGQYWLFADPASLGSRPELLVHLSDGTTLDAIFDATGSNGTANTWSRISGSPELSLGWAQGAVDLVGTYGGLTPNGVNDFYLQAQIVPEPETYAMFLAGLGLMGFMAKRKQTKTK